MRYGLKEISNHQEITLLFTRHAEEALANDCKPWSIKTIKFEIS